MDTLESLFQCDCPSNRVEVLVVINFSETEEGDIKENCLKNYEEVIAFSKKNQGHPLQLFPILANPLPKKWAGVGLARKIGMDEALRRQSDEKSLIVCLDADCTVQKNYLAELDRFRVGNVRAPGCSIKFEHPFTNPGIEDYELFLHYFIEAQRWVGFPFAFQTVGSSMAARNYAYVKAGGMNKRKAGEDFYFLHKVIAQGDFTELNNTCVYPSDRFSTRVPFGTGRALLEYAQTSRVDCYPFEMFVELKKMVQFIPNLYHLDFTGTDQWGYGLTEFLKSLNFEEKIKEIRGRSGSYEVFEKHFFQWFDAFRLMKYGNYLLDKTGVMPDVREEAEKLRRVNKNMV